MTKDGVPNAEEHLPLPPPSKGEERSERGCYPFGRGNAELTAEYWQLTAQAIERRISREDQLYQSFFDRFDYGFRFGVYGQFVIDAVNM